MTKSNSDRLSALLAYPFETGALQWPTAEDKTLIINAAYWPDAPKIGDIDVVQPFYPEMVEWQDVKPTAEIEADVLYDNVLCAVPKQKEAAFYNIACALQSLKKDGLIICMAANDAGGKRLEKWMKEFGLETSSISKSKSRVAWAYKKEINDEFLNQKIIEGARQVKAIEGQNFITQPGIFGWDKIDQGSRLLVKYIPNDLYGHGADYGCGYGFLSNFILKNNSKIKSVIAAEADHNALLCAQENVKKYPNVEFQWCDLTQKLSTKTLLDFVIMNPPFHMGKKTDSDIGQKFIESAAMALKKNGVLYMVANAHLPYEKILNNLFLSVEKLDENLGFKVYKAIK